MDIARRATQVHDDQFTEQGAILVMLIDRNNLCEAVAVKIRDGDACRCDFVVCRVHHPIEGVGQHVEGGQAAWGVWRIHEVKIDRAILPLDVERR